MYTLICVYMKQTAAAAVSQCIAELVHINASVHLQLSLSLYIQYIHVYSYIYIHRYICAYNVYAHICICKIDHGRSSLPVHSKLAHINACIHLQLLLSLRIQYTHVYLHIYIHRYTCTYNVYAHICICKIDQGRSSLPVHSKLAHINACIHLQLLLSLHIQYTHVYLHIYIHRCI